jgi:hypothetical protein
MSEFLKEFPGVVEALATVLAMLGAVVVYKWGERDKFTQSKKDLYFALLSTKPRPGGTLDLCALAQHVNSIHKYFRGREVEDALARFNASVNVPNFVVGTFHNAYYRLLEVLSKQCGINHSFDYITSYAPYYPYGIVDINELNRETLVYYKSRNTGLTAEELDNLKQYCEEELNKKNLFEHIARWKKSRIA